MICVGPAGYPPGSKGPSDAVERAAAMGFTAMEMQFVRQARMAEDKALEAGRRARELGVLLSAHAPYYINFNSPSQLTREKSLEWVMRSARICHQLGAWVVVVHAASYSGRAPSRCTAQVVSALEACRTRMVSEGIGDVLIGLENMGKKGSWGTIEEIGKVVREVEGVVPVLDFAHLHAREGGSLRTRKDFERALAMAAALHEGRLHCHFSCIEYTEQGERRHLPLTTRDPDYRILAGILRRRKGEMTLISETPPPEEGAREMVTLLRESG